MPLDFGCKNCAAAQKRLKTQGERGDGTMEGKLAMVVLIPPVGGGLEGGKGVRNTEADVLKSCVRACVRRRLEKLRGRWQTAGFSSSPVNGTFTPPGEHRVQKETMAIGVARTAVWSRTNVWPDVRERERERESRSEQPGETSVEETWPAREGRSCR